jgi:hypothetical protein
MEIENPYAPYCLPEYDDAEYTHMLQKVIQEYEKSGLNT